MSGDKGRPFRDKALDFFAAALGTPQKIPVDEGLLLYRWKLERPGQSHVSVYITLDSPETPGIAHILISDPSAKQDDPIRSFVMRHESEFQVVLEWIQARLETKV